MRVFFSFCITFFISQGYNLLAQNDVIFLLAKGKDTLETKTLDSIGYQKKFQDLNSLNQELSSLQQKLYHIGYIDALLTNESKKKDSIITRSFSLGTKFEKIQIYYDQNIFSNDIIGIVSDDFTKEKFTIAFPSIEKTLHLLTNHLVDQGKTFSSISLIRIQKKLNSVTAELKILEGKTKTIDKIIVKGYKDFPPSFLKHYSKLKTKRPFNKNKVLSNATRIDNLRFSKNKKPPEVLFKKDSTSVYLYLEKTPANSFDGFLGFSNDSEEQKLQLNGNLNLQLINNLNYGEELNIIYRNDDNNQQRFKIHLSLPYLFKLPFGLKGGLEIFRQDSTFVTTEQFLNLNYFISPKNTIELGYQRTSSQNLLENNNPLLSIENYNSNFINAGFRHLAFHPNKLIEIKRNYFIKLGLGSRDTELDKTNQTKGQITIEQLISLSERNLFRIKNSAAAIFSDNTFFNELFRFGGIENMRGFDENSLNASLYNTLNIEYLYVLSKNLYIHTVTDFGYFEDNVNFSSNRLNSFGFGLGLQSKTGIFRLIFANGNTPNQNFNFQNTKIHLSLRAFF